MFGKVCLYVKIKGVIPLRAEKIKSYIADHHDDAMISLASIAEQFDITPPYLSAFFKKTAAPISRITWPRFGSNAPRK